MQLEDQVVSLELAIKLKELGFKQESLFYWLDSKILFWEKVDNVYKDKYISAYTASELWQHFPQFLPDKKSLGDGYNEELEMGKNDPKNGGDDYTWISYGFYANERDDNAVEAIAKLLIKLKEKNLI